MFYNMFFAKICWKKKLYCILIRHHDAREAKQAPSTSRARPAHRAAMGDSAG